MSPSRSRIAIPLGGLALLALVVVLVVALTRGDGEPVADGDTGGAATDLGDPTDSSADSDGTDDAPLTAAELPTVDAGRARDYGPGPTVGDDPWTDEQLALLSQIITGLEAGVAPVPQLLEIGETGDARFLWPLADIMRFVGPGEAADAMVVAVRTLQPDMEIDATNPWGSTVNRLIAWDVPVPDQYVTFKRDLYGRIEARWLDLLTEDAAIDWRLVGWGGVGIDDRPFGSIDDCRCIPALDDPPTTPATEGDWYPDDALVFGVVIGDEARAYPKNIMEVHEMVNDTLGGRQIALPYCTLCGSAQAYLVDGLPADLLADERPVLRTSGLLSRSNKMMFERRTRSLVDTFTGMATSGPLAEAGVVFDQVSVVTSTWGEWRAAHPETTIVAADGGRGRTYELDPLRGRDDAGPIFPIGDVDPRLPVQEPVLGLLTEDGSPLAIHVGASVEVLAGGRDRLEIDGYEIRLDGSGIRARRDGEDAGGHQAFWFAWSQFHPETRVWPIDFR